MGEKLSGPGCAKRCTSAFPAYGESVSDPEPAILGLRELAALLEQRLAIIGDGNLRDSDPEAQLRQLQQVSESLVAMHGRLKSDGQVPPRLDHFLTQCSYGKALDFVKDKLQS